ncbi:MAG: hypothetical protein L6R19_16655 [Alphaproteobacteria bacterium]|nr:hypothetical protein [Alphaproteobacteria bacterium]
MASAAPSGACDIDLALADIGMPERADRPLLVPIPVRDFALPTAAMLPSCELPAWMGAALDMGGLRPPAPAQAS